MKKIAITLSLSILSIFAIAQSAIVPVGGTATGAGGSVTYTVGQIAVQRVEGGNKYVIEGVQQPYEIQTVGVNEYPGITLQALVYPNPTHNSIQLSIINFDIPSYGLKAQLYDANGKLLQIIIVSDNLTAIDLEEYAAGTYQLRVMNEKRLLKTFKIVKTTF